MKNLYLVERLLLGLIFLVFGLNGFLHFLPMKPPPPGNAAQFLGALASSHYTAPIFALQAIGGVLLLAGRFVPLGLTLLGPIVVNIFLFHALMEPQGLPIALVAVLLWLVAAIGVRDAFAGILASRYTEKNQARL